MPGHDGNGGREYLANEVRAQRGDITKLADKLADIDSRVAGQTVALSTLIESEHRAREHRDKIWDMLNAMRAELQQNTFATAGAQADLASARKAIDAQNVTLTAHETERQRRAGALELAAAVSKPAWVILTTLGTALLAALGWLAVRFGLAPPGSH